MRLRCRKAQQPEPPDPELARHELAGYEAYLREAVRTAEWQWRRAESFERRAGVVLGFAGVVLPLLVIPYEATAGATGWLQTAASMLIAAAAVLLLGSAVASASALLGRRYQAPELAQLRDHWVAFKTEGAQGPRQIVGLFAERLIIGGGGKSPLETLRDDASVRGRRLAWAVRLLAAGIIVVAIATLAVFIQGDLDA